MEIVRRIHALREVSRRARGSGKRIGLVPTMGALHEGHLSLVRRARELSDLTVVSIYVNPTQFGPKDDFEKYPRDLARDADLAIAAGVDYLFAPENHEMYPEGARTFVEVEGLSMRLEGRSRPGHFRGVTTVVLKLFELVSPQVAAFGQKDAQQAIVLKRMVRDLLLDVNVVVCATVRDQDGLAFSSRNAYLAAEERRAAAAIPKALSAAEKAWSSGIRDTETIVQAARAVLQAEPLLRIDYLELVDTVELLPLQGGEREALLAAAVFAGATRLIDNVVLRQASA